MATASKTPPSAEGAKGYMFRPGGPGGGARAVSRGAIAWGQLIIPVAMYTAVDENQPSVFSLIDSRDGAQVGNRQINKITGLEVPKQDVVRGVAVADRYVTLTKEEAQAVLPRTTQLIDIECFVDPREIAPAYFQKPYYLSPDDRNTKSFALLREALLASGKVALAKAVVSTRQYLVAIAAQDDGLVLNCMRWTTELKQLSKKLTVPHGAAANGITADEMEAALGLVQAMTTSWTPEAFTDTFQDKVRAMAAKKSKGESNLTEPFRGETMPAVLTYGNLLGPLAKSIAAHTKPVAAPPVAAKKVAAKKKASAKAPAKAPAAAKKAVKAPVPASTPAAAKKAPSKAPKAPAKAPAKVRAPKAPAAVPAAPAAARTARRVAPAPAATPAAEDAQVLRAAAVRRGAAIRNAIGRRRR